VIVNAGLNLDRDWIHGDTVNPPDYIAIGTGTTGVTAEQTALENEILRKQVSYKSKPGNGQTLHEIEILTTEANGQTITEIGEFNDATAGTMWCRITGFSIPKTSEFSLKIQIITVCERP